MWYLSSDWVFTLIAGVLVYEFYRFTGGWRGDVGEKRDKGEGLDGEAAINFHREKEHTVKKYESNSDGKKQNKLKGKGWRNSKTYKVIVTFLVTTLYLPSSKVAIVSQAHSRTLSVSLTLVLTLGSAFLDF